eukprot:176245-Rhodomonas_salina.1
MRPGRYRAGREEGLRFVTEVVGGMGDIPRCRQGSQRSSHSCRQLAPGADEMHNGVRTKLTKAINNTHCNTPPPPRPRDAPHWPLSMLHAQNADGHPASTLERDKKPSKLLRKTTLSGMCACIHRGRHLSECVQNALQHLPHVDARSVPAALGLKERLHLAREALDVSGVLLGGEVEELLGSHFAVAAAHGLEEADEVILLVRPHDVDHARVDEHERGVSRTMMFPGCMSAWMKWAASA